MRKLASRKAFWALGGALTAAAALCLLSASRLAEGWGARRAFFTYHEAVFRLDAAAAKSLMSEDLARRYDRWLCWTAALSDDMKMNILFAGLPCHPRLRGVAVNRDEALLTMSGETVGGRSVTGRVTMVRANGDWRVHSQKWNVAGSVISL